MASETRDIVERLRDYATCTDSDVDEAATAIESLRATVAGLERALTPQPVKITIQAWGDGDWAVCVNGEPCGQSVRYTARNDIADWLGSAWADLMKANRTALGGEAGKAKQ